MLQLYLLRHAKSDWSADYEDDASRPLNSRGIAAALRVGVFMKQRSIVPNRVLCSPAKRSRETLKLLRQSWKTKPPISVLPELYLQGHDAIIEAIRAEGGKARRLLVTTHNPDIADTASELIEKSRRKTSETLGKFPTAALACLACPIDRWKDLEPRTAKLIAFIRAKEIR
ncbi:MAG: histidine phosphatase family protein [Pseudomonadota bacterium]